ncbi:aminoacyl--tRNA ligase-related protein [Patescibacteria group bacterium]
MKFSSLFTKTLREPPKGEVSINAKLLEQGGFVSKHMSGVYTYLPLGFRVLDNINSIIREEMNAIGGQEMYMPALQPKALWDTTGRWDELSEIMYQFKDRSDQPIGLATTHEEVITSIIRSHIHSYKDLPFSIYQIQDKFRDEPRAKSGLIRGREFAMKDLYSFHADETDLDIFYSHVSDAYEKIFKRCGLVALKIEASGGSFTKQFSHEFQVISDAGEDRLIHCVKCRYAQNKEIADNVKGDRCPECGLSLQESKGIEVGNIFKLGTKFSSAIGATFTASDGSKKPIIMASYGIGPGRLMGTIVEISHDKDGIIWPKEISPFNVHLIQLSNDSKIAKKAELFYNTCQKSDFSVLYDDRNESTGVKLHDADLLGIPMRIVISQKNGEKLECKFRNENKSISISEKEVISSLKKFYT